MKHQAWFAIVGEVLAEEPTHRLSHKRLQKRAVRAARQAGTGKTKEALQNSFDKFVARDRRSEAPALRLEEKHLWLASQARQHRAPQPALRLAAPNRAGTGVEATAASAPALVPRRQSVPCASEAVKATSQATSKPARASKQGRVPRNAAGHFTKAESEKKAPVETLSPSAAAPGKAGTPLDTQSVRVDSESVRASRQDSKPTTAPLQPASRQSTARNTNKAVPVSHAARGKSTISATRSTGGSQPSEKNNEEGAAPDGEEIAKCMVAMRGDAHRKRKGPDVNPAQPAEPSETQATAASSGPNLQRMSQPPPNKKPCNHVGQSQNNVAITIQNASASDAPSWRQNDRRTDVKSGRFSAEEKQTLRDAVKAFAEEHGLPMDDTSWLYATCSQEYIAKGCKGAWQAIAAALPHRKFKSVYSAGTRIFHEANYQGKWDPEDEKKLVQLVKEKGSKWKEIGAILSRMPESCRDKHKECSLGPSKKRGRWDDNETKTLQKAVRSYLAKRTNSTQRSLPKHRSLQTHQQQTYGSCSFYANINPSPYSMRSGTEAEQQSQQAMSLEHLSSVAAAERDGREVIDDIDWGAMSAQVKTRSPLQCMDKWYDQLAPPMTQAGAWGPGDDRRLLKGMMASKCKELHEVPWESIMPHRNRAQCLKRWGMMRKCLHGYWNLTLPATLEQLLSELVPELLEMAGGY